MSAFIDHLATLIEDSISDADASRDDWQAAIKRVFPSPPEATSEMEDSCLVYDPDTGTVLPGAGALVVNIGQLNDLLSVSDADVRLSDEDQDAQAAAESIGVPIVGPATG